MGTRRRLALDVKAEERKHRSNRYSNRSKRVKAGITEAVRAIRADPDPLTVVVKQVLSARRMAEAEYEGVEFAWVSEELLASEGRAVRILTRLWPFMADGMVRRLEARGVIAREARDDDR